MDINGLTPLLVGWNTKKHVLSTFLPVKSLQYVGESSNCFKILEIVNIFFLKFPRVSKSLFDV